MGATRITNGPELAPVLSGTHLPTSGGYKVKLALQREEVGRSLGMTSTGNQTRVARMVAQRFTHYAPAYLYIYLFLYDDHQNLDFYL